jgi:predicted TIM-barrel fold metal-dependent hydrolase
VPIWLPVNYGAPRRHEVRQYIEEFDPSALYDTMTAFPDVTIVITEVQYPQAPWALALLKTLPNLHMELSRFVSTDGVAKLLRIVGESRILFGSRFPDSPLAAQLYHLHLYGLPDSTLAAICAGNLDRLLNTAEV